MNTSDTSARYLTADDIFNCDDIDYIDVEVPEWKKNGKPELIRFRAMTANEAIEFVEKSKNDSNKGDNYVRIVASTAIAVNPDGTNGEQLFRGDVAVHKLREKKSGIFIRLQKAIMKLNNIGGDEEAKNG